MRIYIPVYATILHQYTPDYTNIHYNTPVAATVFFFAPVKKINRENLNIFSTIQIYSSIFSFVFLALVKKSIQEKLDMFFRTYSSCFLCRLLLMEQKKGVIGLRVIFVSINKNQAELSQIFFKEINIIFFYK